MQTLSYKFNRQKLADFDLILHKKMNNDNNDTWNQNWLSENCVHAAYENIIWDDWFHAEIWTNEIRKKTVNLIMLMKIIKYSNS